MWDARTSKAVRYCDAGKVVGDAMDVTGNSVLVGTYAEDLRSDALQVGEEGCGGGGVV